MVTRRVLMGGAASLLLGEAMQARKSEQEPRPAAGARKVVIERDLPEIAMKGWAVTAVEVSYGPGEGSSAHRHPGLTLAYVLEGEVRSKVGDDPERTYGAGEMFIETPGQVHAVSRNASATRPARLLALLLAEKGRPLSAPADE
jgi:quercetin dioxygenase-like cupin family protein